MPKTTINWERCFQDLSRVYPDVKLELETRTTNLFEGAVVPKVLLENRPLCIDVQLFLNQEFPSPETKKKQVSLAIIISDVANRYNLRVFAAAWGQTSQYKLKPHYREYETS